MKGFRITPKYKAAVTIGAKLGLNETRAMDQGVLYEALNKAGCFWNVKIAEWEQADPNKADAPSDVIRVRVWAAADEVANITADLIEANRQVNPEWVLTEQSQAYLCRPPKQADARIYLTFKPKKDAP
jgi:hypothetical protein